MNGIILKNLCKSYELENQKIDVIRDLNLKLDIKERTVLIGESGCGKSTLLKLILGLEEQSRGQILKGDIKCSMVFQTPRLLPWKNVKENIEFSLRGKKDDNLVEKWIDIIKLRDFKKVYPSQLSGGMQSRVSLARAMVAEQDYILMDEPFAALDAFTRSKMQNQLLEIVDIFERGFLFVTHSIDEALKIGQRIVVMKNGQIENDISLEKSNIDKEKLKNYFYELIKGE